MDSNKINVTKFITVILGSLIFICSCRNSNYRTETAGPDEYYTCSMDPQVVENKAGNCPICHMKLIKAKRNNLKAGQIKLSAQQIKLGNITYDTLRTHELAREITLTGNVAIDQNLSYAVSAKVQGRLDKLSVKNVGDFVANGQLLYEIYSEDYSTAQSEYILALHKSPPSKDFIEGAKNKLLLLGMSESQINQLSVSGQPFTNVPVYATDDGFAVEITAVEGNYVSTGTTLFRLSSLTSLWIESKVYLSYLSYLKTETEAFISIPAANEKSIPGKVIFIDPQVQSPERIVLARFQISNPSQNIKPGMMAKITLQTDRKRALALPVDAIIQDSKGAYVWVLNKDSVFENKMVITGLQNSRQVEIMDGLSEGEVVVATGAYLLNSEYVFKKGANPLKGHKGMPGMKM